MTQFPRPPQKPRLAAAALFLALAIQPAAGFEPRPGAGDYFDGAGVALRAADLRFTEGGWLRGRDQGFALAVRRGVADYFIWTRETTRVKATGKPACWGKLLDAAGAELDAASLGPLAIATLAQGRTIYLIASTANGQSLSAWDITACAGEQSLRSVAQVRLNTPEGGGGPPFVVAGDFSGKGEDEIAIIDPATARFSRWRISEGGFERMKDGVIHSEPGATTAARDIRFITQTRLPHEAANLAYEAAFLVLHARGYSLVDGAGTAISFSPSCVERPANCAKKTLIFNLDQGLQGGLQDLMRREPTQAEKVMDRMIATLSRAQTRFNIAVLINPIHEDRDATLRILDRLASAGLDIVLDVYSSDIVSLAATKKEWLNYRPRAAKPESGLSLNPAGGAEDMDSLAYFAARYRDSLAGVRIFERLGLTLEEKLFRMRSVANRNEASHFDAGLAESILAWAQANGKYVLWADPHLYQPYECYLKGEEKAASAATLAAYLDDERRLAQKFGVVVPMYDNNEGMKICGVAYSGAEMTPRNFRIASWSVLPREISSLKQGGAGDFGLSVQSWSSDYDPVMNSVTLPPEEIVMWTLDGFRNGASYIEFEPNNYFFAWPGARGVASTIEAEGVKRQQGEALPSFELLFDYIGLSGKQHAR